MAISPERQMRQQVTIVGKAELLPWLRRWRPLPLLRLGEGFQLFQDLLQRALRDEHADQPPAVRACRFHLGQMGCTELHAGVRHVSRSPTVKTGIGNAGLGSRSKLDAPVVTMRMTWIRRSAARACLMIARSTISHTGNTNPPTKHSSRSLTFTFRHYFGACHQACAYLDEKSPILHPKLLFRLWCPRIAAMPCQSIIYVYAILACLAPVPLNRSASFQACCHSCWDWTVSSRLYL